MTDDPANRVYPAAPEGYDRDDFLPVLDLFESGRLKRVFDSGRSGIYRAHEPRMPNRKADVNDTPHSPARLSLPDVNDRYPVAGLPERQAIVHRHRRHNIGLLHFLQNDPAVPAAIRKDAREWGLCRDEFTQTDHIPPRLYIREARRMVGRHVFTQNDAEPPAGGYRAPLHADSIAISDYILNCHGTGHAGPLFGGEHEGEFYRRVPPCQIPLGVILPKKTTNLLVPVAVSASHVGFSMLRYEPTWMSLGQAAGVVAALAIEADAGRGGGGGVQFVEPRDVQRRLHAAGAMTAYVSDVPPGSPHFALAQRMATAGYLHGPADPPVVPPDNRLPKLTPIVSQYTKAYPHHAARLDDPLDAETETRWRKRAAAAGPALEEPDAFAGRPRRAMLEAIAERLGK